MTQEQIHARLAELDQLRLQIVGQAQHALGMCDGEAAVLKRLLAPVAPDDLQPAE